MNIQLTEAESRLADIIWREETLMSPDLVNIAKQELDWKKSTTYTILKKLCDKGVVKNENARVSVLLTREEQIARQGHSFVESTFGGSLPRFLASFIHGKKLSPKEIMELRQLIDEYDEDGTNG